MNLTSLFLVLIVVLYNSQQVCYGFVFKDDDETAYRLKCSISDEIQELGDDCNILKFYNQTEIELMDKKLLTNMTKHCACQLAHMEDLWYTFFDQDPSVRRVSDMVVTNINKNNSNIRHPVYLWSDIDFTVYKVSVYTSMNDYIEKQNSNKSLRLSPKVRAQLEKDETWVNIRRACRIIARDPFKLFRYLENLNRVDGAIFFRLVTFSEPIDIVYQASKACKILVLPKLAEYKLQPDSVGIVPVEPSLNFAADSQNSISYDINLMLRDASTLLLDCKRWQSEQSSIRDLTRDCPMMMGEKVPSEWVLEHPSITDRSSVAIKCGCQLLMHNSTWNMMMDDPNIKIMSQALTNYLNQNRPPNFSSTPLWTIFGWFSDVMSKLMENRKTSIKEIVKTRFHDQDPLLVINQSSNNYDSALELLRRGCNYIMFNHNKGSIPASELLLIKYLDNLQLISRDPMFVFHLSLQDSNLFKLHALSRMCEPVVR